MSETSWSDLRSVNVSLLLDAEALALLFPAHIRTDRLLRFVSSGPAVLRRTPGLAPGALLSDHFSLDPAADAAEVVRLAAGRAPVVLRGVGADSLLRGVVVGVDDGFVFLLGYVALTASGDASVNGAPPLTPQDLSPSDSARDGVHLLAAQGTLLTAARALADQALAARDAAEAASRAKTEFLTLISHELRDHLHGVIGLVGALGASPLTPEQAEMVSLIAHSGSALTRVVDDVLDFVGGSPGAAQKPAETLPPAVSGAAGPREGRAHPDTDRPDTDRPDTDRPDADSPDADPPGAAGTDSDQEAPVRALVAEDHPANRRIIELMLAPMGVDVTLVANGAEAVEAFKRHDWELVLLDMQMPVLDGVSAARAMRDLEAGLGRTRTPIAMLSANVLPRHVDDAMQAGADHFIAKPVTPAALAQGLDDLIRAAAANAEMAGRG
jgi:CheY-like chemotaxis protein